MCIEILHLVSEWGVSRADGSGGVCAAESGAEYWVLAVDESAGRCVIKL